MLTQFLRHTWQVLIRPCKDVPALTKELDEHAFLFVGEAAPNPDGAVGVLRVDRDLLGLLAWLECQRRLEVPHAGKGELGDCARATAYYIFFFSSEITIACASAELAEAQLIDTR